MDQLIIVACVAGGMLLLLGGAGLMSRFRVPLGLLVAVAAVVTGLVMGTVLPADGLSLPQLVGLQRELLLLLAWAAFGGLAAAAGGLRLPGPPIIGAALSGALLGELGAAAALSQTATGRRGAARLALAAMGGALLGRIGDPAVLALGPRLEGRELELLPLGLLLVLVAWPTSDSVRARGGTWMVTAVALGVGLGALLLPQATTGLLAGGAVVMAALAAPRIRASQHKGDVLGQALGPLLWTVASAAVVLVVTASGLPELAAQGIEEIREPLVPWIGPAAAAAGALLAALVDGVAAGLLGAGLLDRALSLRLPDAHLALAIGLATGGLGPLVIAGALRQGLLRWLAQVILAVAYAALLLH